MEHKEKMFQAAKAYGKAGWAIFPLLHFSKKPAVKKGFLAATTNELYLNAWWKGRKTAGANIGYAVPDGTLILDVDVREEKNGEAEFHKLIAQYGALPATRQVTTASGGWHLYFRVPLGFAYKKELVAGCIDLKGPGGYVLLPPSALVAPRADGAKAKAQYTWDGLKGFEEPIAELPAAWLAACQKPEPAASGPKGNRNEGDDRPALLAPIEAGCAWCAHGKAEAAHLPEPEWYALLGILGRCENGRELAHEWSKPYHGYSKAETDAKLDHALTAAGPITCLRVADELAGRKPFCEQCPHWGKITSPIVLGSVRAGEGFTNEPWGVNLLRNQKDRVIPNLANALLTLTEHHDWKGQIQYNEFSDTVEFLETPAGTGMLTDGRQLETVVWLQRYLASGINEHMTRSALELAARRRPVHPLRDELRSLRQAWDGKPRITEQFFRRYCGVVSSQSLREGHAEDHELYLEHVAVCFFVSLAARAWRPGCRIEHVLVLEGGEPGRKTRALEILTGRRSGVLTGKLESPQALESLRGAWCVEVPEPALYEAGPLREFLTRTHDKQRTEFWRPAYGRLWQAVPRSCVFTVTGESSDELFGWRAMPVECGRIDLQALARDAEQLRGEADCLLRERNAQWWPSFAIRPLLDREQRGRKVQDPLTLRIERYIETHGHISILEMLDAFNIPTAQQSAAVGRRAARILASRGYRLSEESGGVYWVDPGKPSAIGEILQ